MNQNGRMRVNAAMESLISREDNWVESACTVIALGHTLKIAQPVSIETKVTKTSGGESITGQTSQGPMTIRDKKREETKETSFGVLKERIGFFRLWRQSHDTLCFHRFENSHISTRGLREGPDTYRLVYDQNTLMPKQFGVEQKVPILSLGIFSVWAIQVVLIFGEKPFSSLNGGFYIKFG